MHVRHSEKPHEIGTKLVGVLPGFSEGRQGRERPVAPLARLGRAGGAMHISKPSAADSLQVCIV